MTNNARKTLPENVIPLTYDLSLEPDLDTFTFDGEVQIFVELKNATDEITLNAAELTIHSSSVQIDDDIIVGGSLQSDDDETITINLGKRYNPGKATVNISFSGELGIAVRTQDKVCRLRHILGKGGEVNHEAKRDTYMDMANYGLIGMMLDDGSWLKGS